MTSTSTLTESDFHQRVDAVLVAIETAIDACDGDADIDSALSAGILTLTFEDDSKIIINRQTPTREIWVAAKSGGYHFRLQANRWLDTRSGNSLDALLADVVAKQSGANIVFTLS